MVMIGLFTLCCSAASFSNDAPGGMYFKGNSKHISILMMNHWTMKQALAFFSERLGKHVVYGSNVERMIRGRIVSDTYNEMTWSEALESFAVSKGFEIIQESPSALRMIPLKNR
jgi:hypothetical protein